VVESLATTARRLAPISPRFATIEEQPTEGTREQYVGPEGGAAMLLLCEPVDPAGPYGSALARRGPGLHHVGLSVPRLADYLAALAGSGWYLLPQSARTIPRGVAWLARPGVHTLIELCEMPEATGEPFVTGIEIPMLEPDQELIARLGLPERPLHGVRAVPAGPSALTIGGRHFEVRALAGR
jgi:methylmalonyl-CoA/ethylmalonyl-CoA epimerase